MFLTLNKPWMYRLSLCLSAALLLLSSFAALAENYLSHTQQQNSVVVKTDQGTVTLSAISANAFEVLYAVSESPQLPSFALDKSHPSGTLTVKNTSNSLVVSTGTLTAVVDKSPLTIRYYQGKKLLLEEESGLYVKDSELGFRFKLQAQEKLIGGGQRVLGMDRRGHKFPLYNKAHYGYTTESNQMYFGLSAVLSNQGYALIFDNSAKGEMDLGHTQADIMQFSAVGGRTSYVLIGGESYPDIIHNFVQVTGKQPLPPRWALGNFASRFGYKSEQQTRETVQGFIDKDFPLDAVVLDLYWFGNDIKGFMGNLAWDKESFPTPEKMIADFKQLGVKTILITEPFVLSTSDRWQEAVEQQVLAKDASGQPKRFDFYFGNTGLIDVFDDKASKWFTDIYHNLYQQGVKGWWGDLGEPEVHPGDSLHQFNGLSVTGDEIHNAYGHMWAQRVYNNQLAIAPNERPFIMMRSGFVGSQRFGMLPWTGDVSRSWDGLKPQVELALQMSLLGLAYTHSDLGGFAGGEKFDQELYIRWLQYGVFQPVFRPHAQDNIAPEPIFHDQQTQDIVRTFVKLRYAMLPYNYSLAYQNSLTGMPLMRPVFFDDPQNHALIAETERYFWGDALLVQPITEPNLKQVTMSLPKGLWFDFWTDKKYQGEQAIKLKTQLDRLPVMVIAGAFLPMVEPVQSIDHYHTKSLQMHYYAHDNKGQSQYTLYDDDGQDPQAIANSAYQSIRFSAAQNANKLTLSMAHQGQYKGMPKSRTLDFILHNWPAKPQRILSEVNGQSLPLSPEQVRWDADKKLLFINLEVSEDLVLHLQ
ncbi:glycoside hydrolase family 31 protein [Paraglaciecola aestuariivivens]